MVRLAVLAFLCLGLTLGAASAKTWVVLPDSTGDAPTIKAGIDSAGAGDTVMVMSGTYYEANIGMKSGVCLTSETGTADCVTIDGQYEGRVFYAQYTHSTTSIVGFTITHGHARDYPYGGGMTIWTNSYLRVTNCTFQDNLT
jgi:hypothetical protein